jgi:hypothetical protein
MRYRWTSVVPGFDMPLRITVRGGGEHLLHPTTAWSTDALPVMQASDVVVDPDFFVVPRVVPAP